MQDPIAQVVALLSRLPGVGERTATRLAYFVLESDPDYPRALGKALLELPDRVQRCDTCGNYATETQCGICRDASRDDSLVCVVARPPDIAAIERSAMFRGRYHVLHGLLSPLDGMGPERLALAPLLTRIREGLVREVIIATPLHVEGEATALYLSQTLQALGVACSRIASGMPHGGELEFTDQVTLTRAFEGRRQL